MVRKRERGGEREREEMGEREREGRGKGGGREGEREIVVVSGE